MKATASRSVHGPVRRAPLAFTLATGLLLCACGPVTQVDRGADPEIADGGGLASGGAGGSETAQLPGSGGAGGDGVLTTGGSGGTAKGTGGSAGSSATSGSGGGVTGTGGSGEVLEADAGGSTDPGTAADAATGTDTHAKADAAKMDTTSAPDAAGGPPSAADLLAKLGSCSAVSTSKYATDDGQTPSVSICGLKNAVYWKADMDVDCDGKSTTACSAKTDPWYQDQTSATDSKGGFLDASALPYVVIPLPSSRFDYSKHGIQLGTVVAVIYNNKVEYGVFGDEGPDNIIGEASYAMAKSLGIDSNPDTGGVDTGVTYIVFTGSTGKVSKIEDHTQATTVGETRAAQLIREN